MIPIKWDETENKWVTTTAKDPDWYDYANQKWANAKTADNSFWVWIPRYAYKIETCYHQNKNQCNTDTGKNAGEIDVKFLINDTNITIDDTTIYEDNATNTHYVLHPAFTFGDKELTGIWVAKFEMSGSLNSLVSKAGLNSLVNVTVGDMFTASRNMEKNANYGWPIIPDSATLGSNGMFSTESGATPSYNGVDTHMMKNIEWGAVAYLSQSQYGKYGNDMYTGVNKEIYQNKSNSYKTGNSNGTPSQSGYITTQCQYLDITDRGSGTGSCGGGASTTGNIYGIYDMSGGAFEYVMANYNYVESDSGIADVSLIDNKYIDIYTAYNNTKYGDAIYETSSGSSGSNSWYSDRSDMSMISSYPWFRRGGYSVSDATAGAFFFGSESGGGIFSTNSSWRVVLAVDTGL